MSSHRKDSLNLPELTGGIENRIYILRGQRVMLSFDLAASEISIDFPGISCFS